MINFKIHQHLADSTGIINFFNYPAKGEIMGYVDQNENPNHETSNHMEAIITNQI